MSKRTSVLVLAILAVCGSAALVTADPQGVAIKKAAEEAARANGTLNEWQPGDPVIKPTERRVTAPPTRGGMATIQYDDGVQTGTPNVNSECFGNRFNTRLGNSLAASGNITGAQVYMAGVAGGVFMSFFDQLNTGLGTANFISSASITGLSTGWNTFATTHSYVGNTFLAGAWYFGGDSVALGTGTTNTQGHHGMRINDIVGTGYNALTTVNTLFRVSGNPIPIELMTFSVE